MLAGRPAFAIGLPQAVRVGPPPEQIWMCACRYLSHTLRNSKHTVETIDEADVVYVYDYCYTMWLLSDHHAREHWWLKQNYEPPPGTGRNLLSVYRQELAHNATVPQACSPALTETCQSVLTSHCSGLHTTEAMAISWRMVLRSKGLAGPWNVAPK